MKHKKDKIAKTNALRQLDKQKIPYIIHTYEWSEDKSGGLGVAEKFPELAERVFKTIVLKGKSKNLYVITNDLSIFLQFVCLCYSWSSSFGFEKGGEGLRGKKY